MHLSFLLKLISVYDFFNLGSVLCFFFHHFPNNVGKLCTESLAYLFRFLGEDLLLELFLIVGLERVIQAT